MRRTYWMGCVVLMLAWCESRAAIIQLTNAEDGSAAMQLAPFGAGTMNVAITTSSVDTITIAFVNAFLDTSGDSVDVMAVQPGMPKPPWEYDRSSFELPAEMSQDQGNEYALISGNGNDNSCCMLIPGTGTYIIDQLTLQNDATDGGSVNVIFELGPRKPYVFGPSPTFLPYTTAPTGAGQDMPNHLYVGDANSNNTAFVITLVPEPASLVLLSLSASIFLKRRQSHRVSE